MEKTINEGNLLVDRSINNQDFLEDEIKAIVIKILDFSNDIIYSYSEQIKNLFKKIICMDKSTGSFGFYYFLTVRDLYFSEELFLFGLKNEPYYNNNDAVLVCYLIVASRKNGIEDSINYFLENTKISKGHYSYYDKIFRGSYLLRNSITVPGIPSDMENEILDILENNKFYQTVSKAIAVVVFFDMKSAIPSVINKFQSKEEKDLDNPEHLILSLRALSLSLYYLTGINSYKEFYDYSISKDISFSFDKKNEIKDFAVSLLEKIH